MNKSIVTSGKRKSAIARASLTDGSGIVTINGIDLKAIKPELVRLLIQTPLLLADEAAKKVDIAVHVSGGGFNSQAEASALAIAKALAKHDKHLDKVFLAYDRQLLVADVRRKECSKPNKHGQARAKRQKSYR